MASRFGVIAVLLAALACGAAQAQQSIVPYVVTGHTSGGAATTTPVGNTGSHDIPMPVSCTAAQCTITVTAGLLTPVAGTQVALSIASATALTVPAGATVAVIQAQGTNNSSGVCLYWQDDGTSPTGSAGQQMAAGATLTYAVAGLPIKLIAATGATCTATISYYHF